MIAVIRGTGASLPETRLTNAELERRVATTDDWIVTRTGVRERRVLGDGEATSDMAVRAARAALGMAGRPAEELDLIVVATVTPDMFTPSTANRVQEKLRVGRPIPSFDLGAACSGFLYGMDVVCELLRSGRYRSALLIGAETLTRFTDYQDRGSCILFGDGAGAVLLEAAEESEGGVLASTLKADPQFWDLIRIPGGAAARPPSPYVLTQREVYLRMEGRQVFKLAVQSLEQVAHDTLEQVGWEIDEVDHVVLHQANRRILNAVAERLGLPERKRPTNLHRTGNTGAASIPILLDECQRAGRFRPGDRVLMLSFGAGITWAGVALRWALEPGELEWSLDGSPRALGVSSARASYRPLSRRRRGSV
ncbi:MAG: beta-ketoacyl-ACP synthase III [Myxococcota bacterium]